MLFLCQHFWFDLTFLHSQHGDFWRPRDLVVQQLAVQSELVCWPLVLAHQHSQQWAAEGSDRQFLETICCLFSFNFMRFSQRRKTRTEWTKKQINIYFSFRLLLTLCFFFNHNTRIVYLKTNRQHAISLRRNTDIFVWERSNMLCAVNGTCFCRSIQCLIFSCVSFTVLWCRMKSATSATHFWHTRFEQASSGLI